MFSSYLLYLVQDEVPIKTEDENEENESIEQHEKNKVNDVNL